MDIFLMKCGLNRPKPAYSGRYFAAMATEGLVVRGHKNGKLSKVSQLQN